MTDRSTKPTDGEPLDRITLAGMSFSGRHGVLDVEQTEPQPFVVSVTFPVDAERVAFTDALGDTVDYAAVFESVRRVVEERSYRLIETLADSIASALLEYFSLPEVEVRVRKPKAPLPGAFEHVEISVVRRSSRPADEGVPQD